MITWNEALHNALRSGSAASALSALTLAVCGKVESGTFAGPLNGPSQWIWGQRAAHRRQATLRHTAIGYAIHHATSIFWATLHEKHVARLTERRSPAMQLAAAAGTAVFASFVDYQIAKGRLQPGFDKQLSRKSLFLVYSSFALGLTLTQMGRSRSYGNAWSRSSRWLA
jgi:hypothetical protein